jgi:LacI family transcriptional regulator
MSRKKTRLPKTLRIGLVLQTGEEHMRGVTRGVFRYLRRNPHWQIAGHGQYPLLRWDQLSQWDGDGIIAIPNQESHLRMLLKMAIPSINAGSRLLDQRLVTVAGDNQIIGTLAADHLLACGLRSFLIIGEMQWENERLRHQAFESRIAAAGLRCKTMPIPVHESFASDASAHYEPDSDQVVAALTEIAKPVGIFAPNSVLARLVLQTAQSCGLLVPDEVAVIGVNDDPLVCESTNPALSAVVQASEKIGFEAAMRLDRLMNGRAVSPAHTFISPLGIAARRSTDMLAVNDEDVRLALRFIRDHAHEPIDVADVAEHVSISRRSLETKMQKAIGRTPAVELQRVRLRCAKQLLAETIDPITSVVFASGFNSRQVFCHLFRRETGMTPSDYRRQFQTELVTGS